jgi:hypothetical protein
LIFLLVFVAGAVEAIIRQERAESRTGRWRLVDSWTRERAGASGKKDGM